MDDRCRKTGRLRSVEKASKELFPLLDEMRREEITELLEWAASRYLNRTLAKRADTRPRPGGQEQ